MGLFLSNLFSEPFGSLRKYLQSHSTRTFRALLFGGILLLIVGLVFLLPFFEQHRGYYLWLAGLTTTLALSFLFAILSARINGYRRYKDTMLGFVTAMMLLLSGVLALSGMFHH
jgi:hypothetical protein